ncbi:MAG: hypothetical protein A2X67_14405 [Ignavibacteria bacterium GWA2_55_11]|nr:MAG: hypothetical protein A2X67_14405 [Ignavibacteria bacterium GWA2_55_11]OGU45821.1 MAG: hypothetical protein A2X68_11895 [Ignavibacteria bacterium GWC2_56_12]OGU75744.1 MAG: hypothetical protein A3H45_05845 [Ignavibacteria bacterium RIFCSPLOWO2_02_FULL_55_14]OGU76838.1 MAG: hypothetical protein A3G43_09890 [Ignavibacteria bacterium RIFCSPLOWO2_12_FULL_56_21]
MSSIGALVKEHPLYTVSGSLTVLETARYMTEKNVGALPVVDANQLVGIFSERDMVTRVIAKGLDPKTLLTRDVMTTRLVVAQMDESLDDCLLKMQQAHCRHMPVVKGEHLVGFVSLRDLLQLDITAKDESLEYLHSYIYTVPPGMAKRYETH